MKNYLFILLLIVLFATTCKKDNRQLDTTYNPELLPSNFTNSTALTNTYLPFEDGKKYIFEGQTEDGLEHIEVQRLSDTKVILGITCVIVNDKVFLNGKLIEDTDDWYAQDNDGNVWYLGEDVDNFNADGSFKDHAGAWEAGVDGAKPGIVMPADPKPGMTYRQEYYFNEAEDEAEVLETGIKVSVPFGPYDNCLKTREWTDLEPDVNEHKFYAPGTGLIKETSPADKVEIVLIDIQG